MAEKATKNKRNKRPGEKAKKPLRVKVCPKCHKKSIGVYRKRIPNRGKDYYYYYVAHYQAKKGTTPKWCYWGKNLPTHQDIP